MRSQTRSRARGSDPGPRLMQSNSEPINRTDAQFVPALDELPETQLIIEKNFAAAPDYQMCSSTREILAAPGVQIYPAPRTSLRSSACSGAAREKSRICAGRELPGR